MQQVISMSTPVSLILGVSFSGQVSLHDFYREHILKKINKKELLMLIFRAIHLYGRSVNHLHMAKHLIIVRPFGQCQESFSDCKDTVSLREGAPETINITDLQLPTGPQIGKRQRCALNLLEKKCVLTHLP